MHLHISENYTDELSTKIMNVFFDYLSETSVIGV